MSVGLQDGSGSSMICFFFSCFFPQQSNLEAFKTAILAKVPDNQLVDVWLKLLTQLIEDLERCVEKVE